VEETVRLDKECGMRWARPAESTALSYNGEKAVVVTVVVVVLEPVVVVGVAVAVEELLVAP
jgi:hypothetical protein